MINFNKPLFITFEGGDGSGKSTQSKMLYESLLSKGIKTIHTREVGGTAEAEKIRDILVYSDLYPISQLMLVMAARYEHINKVIIPALVGGSSVICDRFVDSTVCYQSGDSGLSIKEIYDLHFKLMKVTCQKEAGGAIKPQSNMDNYSQTALMPDITFFMDMPPEEALDRALLRGDANKFDKESNQYHKQIYDRFKLIAEAQKERIKTVDCVGKNQVEIHQAIMDIIFKE